MSDVNKSNKPGSTGSFFQSIKMIAWAFLGIRKNSDSQEDTAKINPFHIIVVGLLGVVILVVSLIVLVGWVVGK